MKDVCGGLSARRRDWTPTSHWRISLPCDKRVSGCYQIVETGYHDSRGAFRASSLILRSSERSRPSAI